MPGAVRWRLGQDFNGPGRKLRVVLSQTHLWQLRHSDTQLALTS